MVNHSKIAAISLCLIAAFEMPTQAAEWKLEPVETINGIQIFSIPDPAKPEFQRLLAKPAGDGPFPAVVVNHGGRSGADFIRECLAFPANGFVAIACDLRHKEIPVEDFRDLKWEAAPESADSQPASEPASRSAAQPPPQMAPIREGLRNRVKDPGHWVDPVTDAPAETQYKTLFSKTINGPYSYLVYLPPDYEKNTGKNYPAIYWLHGGGGTQRTGEYFVEDYVQAMKDGQAPEAILILVNGVGSSSFCDSFDGKKPVESVIVNDLIPHVDATYRTFGTRAMRAIEGFSMGGFGALHLAFKFPEKFGSMTALSHAPIRPNSGWEKVDLVYREGPFAGNLDYFNANDPFQLVEKNAATIKDGMTLRFIVGDKDQPNTQARTKEFYEKAQKLGMKSTLTIVPGVAHNCPKLYEKLGEPAFAYYQQLFAANQPATAGQP